MHYLSTFNIEINLIKHTTKESSSIEKYIYPEVKMHLIFLN